MKHNIVRINVPKMHSSIIDNLDPAKTKTYSYDALYRLANATGPWGTIQYDYDPVGNRTVETAGAGTTNYAYTANKIMSSTGAKPFAFGYDRNGNTIAESRPLNAERSYIYNQNQRLIRAVKTDTGTDTILGVYVYNGNGQRVKKTVNGKVTYFMYDQSGNLLEEIDSEGRPVSDYIYLGGTPIGRVDIQYDTAPPVTTAEAGVPKYQTTSNLYIAGATAITLSAIDEGATPSGVEYTEYRLDDSALWIRYTGQFSLGGYSDGAHTIFYRSIDKAGNLEDAKALSVMLDRTAPASSINAGTPQYQAGELLYIGSNTPVAITAADAGSGTGKLEFAVDSNPFRLYAEPFTLAGYGDGPHTIKYRSADNVMNQESEKSFSIMLDSTPPSTVISASDELIEGVINTVSPRTRFFLNATDSATGIKEIQYRLNNGTWNTYLAGFPQPSIAGAHTIGYRAIDNLGNEEAEKTLTVKMIVIDVTKVLSLEPVVLAGVWGSTSSTQTAISNLAAILADSGISYYIPQTEGEFKASLRSGRYNTYLLIDFNREDLKDELKEAIHYGDGLVYIKTVPNNIPVLQELFGVQFSGMSTYQNLTVNLTESPISGPATLQTIDKDIKTTITSEAAQSLGYVIDKNLTYPVIVYNHYGRGRVLLFSFDLLNSPEQGKVKELIVNAIRYVAPTEQQTRSLSDIPVKITLQNSTEAADVKVMETSGNTAIGEWQLTLGSGESRAIRYQLNVPDASGEYQLGTELRYRNQTAYRLYGNFGLTLSVATDSGALLAQIVADLQALTVTGENSAHLNSALYYLGLVRDYTGITKPDAQNNVTNILNAVQELGKVTIDVLAIRLKLDELLKIWQAKWNLAPEVVSGVSRYRLAYETDARKAQKRDTVTCHSGLSGIGCAKSLVLASAGPTTGLLNSSTTSEVLYFYHTDHLGTPMIMTDHNQGIIWQGEFLPFGEPYSITGTITNNLRFPGQYYDEESGLHQNWHRDYKPAVGRYIERDPIGFEGGDVNLMRYVGNNPVRRIDPLGLDYTDINFSLGIITVGGMFVDGGFFYPYLGYGLASPGMSVTVSTSDPSLGWNMGFQPGYFIFSGQVGLVEDDIQSPVWFGELGFGTPGIAITRYFVFKKQSYDIYMKRSDASPLAKCH